MAEAEAELNSILEEALKLRQNKDAVLKRYFDSLPACVQKTLFDEAEAKNRSVDEAKKLERKGDDHMRRGRVVDALVEYEQAVGNVFFVTLRPNAPHWRERGVQDEWIKVNKLDDVMAAQLLGKVAECLFKLNQWNECISNADQAIKLSPKTATVAYLNRGRARLKVSRPDAEDLALRDFVKVTELEPENETAKTLIADLRTALNSNKQKEKAAFGGLFNKPGVRLVADEDEVKKEKTQPVKVDLDPLELEAAKFAGLDVNDPAIRQMLIKLSTKEGRELFDREEERLKKLEKKESAQWWLVIAIFLSILLAITLQHWLKSMTVDKPVSMLGSIHRVQAIKNQMMLPGVDDDNDDEFRLAL